MLFIFDICQNSIKRHIFIDTYQNDTLYLYQKTI